VNVTLLVLGCILMISGALLKYTEEIEKVEEKIEEKKEEKVSSWRLRDLEYRLKKIEKEKAEIKE